MVPTGQHLLSWLLEKGKKQGGHGVGAKIMKGTYYLDTLLKKSPRGFKSLKLQALGVGATEATVSVAYLGKKGVEEKVTELSIFMCIGTLLP